MNWNHPVTNENHDVAPINFLILQYIIIIIAYHVKY